MIDLWPEGISSRTSLRAPVTILKEQGTFLGRRTSNIVEGVVARGETDDSCSGDFKYNFYLISTALGDYHHRLLSISHSADFYPLTFNIDEDVLEGLPNEMKSEHELTARSEERFIVILEAIFATKKVRRVIEAIIAQSGGDVE